MNLPVLGPEEPDALYEDTLTFWREAGKTLVRDSVHTLDETAKQLIAVAGILVGLYFHAIAFGDLRGRFGGWALLPYLAPIILLLLSLVASTSVFFPSHARLNLNAWQPSKLVYERAVRRKLWAVRLSSAALLLGVLSIAVAAVAYLRG